MKNKTRFSLGVIVALITLIFSSHLLRAQNNDDLSITNWNLASGNVQSQDVRIYTSSTSPSPGDNYFDAASFTQSVALIKNENTIYVRFSSMGIDPVPDGGVKVTASYATVDPGLTAVNLAALDMTTLNWTEIGDYTMSLVLATDPVDNYLYLSDWYPRSQETGDPTRYDIVCSVACTTPLPIAFILKVELEFTDTSVTEDYEDDNIAYSYYDQSGGMPPVDVMLVLDYSGSMMGELPMLKDRAKMFVDLLNINDRVGAVAFSGSSYSPCLGTSSLTRQIFSLQSIATDAQRTIMKSSIDAVNIDSGGCMTPMGAGLVFGRDALIATPPLPASNQAIVLLTDGKENVSPEVNVSPYTILGTLDTNGIALYPLWFGTASDWGKSLLENIVTEVSDGKLVDQPQDDLALAKAYLMIRGILTSDDVYRIHKGISDDGFKSALQVDPITNELILTVAWRDMQKRLAIEAIAPGEKTWQDASAYTRVVFTGGAYTVYRLRNPAPGTWQYRLKNNDYQEPYVIAAMADTVEILMKSDLQRNAVRASEPLTIMAELTRSGVPVKGAVVNAEISVPKKSLGTILLNMRDKLKDITATPGTDISRGQLVAKRLPKLLGTGKIIDYGTITVKLRDDGKNGDTAAGDGFYTCVFDNTKVAGTYRVKIVAENAPGAQVKYHRQHEHSAVVNIGPIDPVKSIVDIVIDKAGAGDYNTWKVMVCPVDKWGNASYPGYGSKLNISASAGTWQGGLVDYEDGSYYRLLRLKKGETAGIKVTAYGEKLPTVSTDKVARPWQVSFHQALVFPAGDFANLVDEGYGFLFDLGYRFHPNFSLIAHYGIGRFPHKLGGYANINNLSLNLRARRLSGIFSLYTQAGAGMYRLFKQWDPGINVGAGIVYPLTGSFELEAGTNYHSIFTDGKNTLFIQVHLGFNYRFQSSIGN